MVGTIRAKPYLPTAVSTFNMDIGDSVAIYNYQDEVTLQCTRANKTKRVMLVSTIHHKPTMIDKKSNVPSMSRRAFNRNIACPPKTTV